MRKITVCKRTNCEEPAIKGKGLCKVHQAEYNEQYRPIARKVQIAQLVERINNDRRRRLYYATAGGY